MSLLSGVTPEDLVAKYTQPLEEGNEFEVFFPGGEPLKCWFPTRPSDIHGWKQSLSELWQLCSKKLIPGQWKDVLTTDGKFQALTWDECVTMSVLVYWTGPKPQDKLTQFQALKLLRAGGGYVATFLQEQIERKHQELGFTRFVEKVEEEKKDSLTILEEGSSSSAPSSTSESTPTA